MSKLIILRGNSGSGKTTIAKALQKKLGHNTRNKSLEFGEEDMRKWWREKDFSSDFKEQIITCDMDVNYIVEKIYLDLHNMD